MEQPSAAPYPISDFRDWHKNDQLILAPKFQRRDVWIPKAKSFLIDTILRKMPIPPIFLRLRIDPGRQQAVREVVDGQQRLNSVLQFLQDEFSIIRTHNKEFAGKLFSQFPDNIQNQFLSYKFIVHTLEDVSDAEVLNIFARLNTYTESLMGQELINASYFGEFKQEVYQIAHKYYPFWIGNRILNERGVARMADAALVSELYIVMIDGIRSTGIGVVKKYYENYDDRFPLASKLKERFENIIDEIGNIYGEKISNSPYNRAPLFYTLFSIIYDARYGLPDSKKDRIRLSSEIRNRITRRMDSLAEMVKSKEGPENFDLFKSYARAATTDVGKRRYRHEFMWQYILENNDDPKIKHD